MPHSLYDIAPLEPLISEGRILLTPNYRLARRIKAQWDARCVANALKTWQPPSVYPLEAWLHLQWDKAVSENRLAPVVPLNAAQEMQLWLQVIDEQALQATEYNLLRPAAAAELASRARNNLRLWQVDTTQPELRQAFNFDKDCATFLSWLEMFEQRLAAAGLATSVDCIQQLLLLDEPRSKVSAVLVECGELVPLHRAVLAMHCEDVTLAPTMQRHGHRLVHPFSDKRAELRAVATWAADLYSQDSSTTVGIVLTDMGADRVPLEYLLRRQFQCLGANYNSLPVNFSTGITLSNAPAVRDALAALALGLQQIRVPDVVALLQSRFLNLPDAHSAIAARFLTRLYEDGRETLDVADLRVGACNVRMGEQQGLMLGQHLLAMSRMRELKGKALPSRWAELFSAVLSLWGWPGPGSLDSLEFQQVESWYRILDEFKGLDTVCTSLNFSDALALLRNTCSNQVSQPQTVDSNIQVLGPLEAAGLAFDHLWLCGMQGSAWPAPVRPNPLIPLSLQSRLQMPHATAEREWAYGESMIRQYAQSAGTLHASYCRQLDGIQDLASPLLEDFAREEIAENPSVDDAWTSRSRQRSIEQLEDSVAPIVDPDQDVVRGGSGLLEDQSQCPFRAFASRRLQVAPLADFNVALSAAERGTLLHDALFALWGEISDQSVLLELDQFAEAEVVQRATEAAISSVPDKQRRAFGKTYWTLEKQRLTDLLLEWLAVERQRTAFVVEHREQDITLELARLKIKLRVDRIDRLPDGSQVIIDYKSGRSSVQDWLGDRPAKPQLLLYSIAAPVAASALAFAQVRPRDCSYVGLGAVDAAPGISVDIAGKAGAKMAVEDWPGLNERWRQSLEDIATEFVNGEARVAPLTPASCQWCGLQPLCRIDRLEAESGADQS